MNLCCLYFNVTVYQFLMIHVYLYSYSQSTRKCKYFVNTFNTLCKTSNRYDFPFQRVHFLKRYIMCPTQYRQSKPHLRKIEAKAANGIFKLQAENKLTMTLQIKNDKKTNSLIQNTTYKPKIEHYKPNLKLTNTNSTKNSVILGAVEG